MPGILIGRTKLLFSLPTMASNDDDKPILFANRPEWADVVPQEQYEDGDPLAPIFYSVECS